MRAEDEAEFAELVALLSHRLHRLAYAVCGDRPLAEDAVQSALVSVYRTWPRRSGCGQSGGIPAHDGRESAPELAPKEVVGAHHVPVGAEPASRAGPPTRTSTSSSSGSGLPSPTYRLGAER